VPAEINKKALILLSIKALSVFYCSPTRATKFNIGMPENPVKSVLNKNHFIYFTYIYTS